GEPATKIYPGRLVLFPVIYQMTVTFAPDTGLEPISWDSARPSHEGQYKELKDTALVHDAHGLPQAAVTLRYRLRVYATQQFQEHDQAQQRLRLTALALLFGTVAFIWFYLLWRGQREREQQRVEARQLAAEAERKRLEEELKRQDAERRREEAERTAL